MVSVAVRPPLTKRLGPSLWVALDVVVAVVLLAALLAFVAGHRPRHVPSVELYGLVVLSSLPVALRRRCPLLVLAVVLPASVAFGAVAAATATVSGATYVLYTVVVQTERRQAVMALVAVECGVAVTFGLTTSSSVNPVNGAFTALAQITVWIIGDSVRRYRAYKVSLEEQTVRQAVSEERVRIARELHDMVAHAMSVVAVQAGVGHHVIADQPDEAAKALESIEVTARDALAEMRHLLGVLRSDEAGPASLRPSPGLGSLQLLVDQVSSAGLPVTLRVEGRPRALAPSVDLSAYRIVQEALTNVVKHAEEHSGATVAVCYDGDDVVVTVIDDGRGDVGERAGRPGRGRDAIDGAGQGLTGMRERVNLFGGELQVGPRPDGGFGVRARLRADGLTR